MRVEAFDDPLVFREAAAPLARSNAPLLAFVHAWTGGVASNRPDRCYMAVASDRDPEGFALQRDEGPILLGACSDAEAIAFADAYASIDRDAAGVMGTERTCGAFAARWREVTGRTHRLRHRMRNHVLRTLVEQDVEIETFSHSVMPLEDIFIKVVREGLGLDHGLSGPPIADEPAAAAGKGAR